MQVPSVVLPTIKNKTELEHLLTIEDPITESIYDVIGRMEVLLDFFKQTKEYHGFVPFLHTYYLVTKAVAQKYVSHKRFFYNVKDLMMLDAYFASLYFKPLLAFLENGVSTAPWKTYFTYCSQEKKTPFVQILLGINAHINTDLYSSLVATRYRNQKDYFIVNDILMEVTPGVMRFLAKEHDFVGFGDVIFKKFIDNEFHLVIEKWRSTAWASANLTDRKNNQLAYSSISSQTEKIGEDIIEIFDNLFHLKGVSTAIQRINELSVI